MKTAALEAQALQTVTFVLKSRDVSVWDVNLHKFTVVSGRFNVKIGSSSEDIRLMGYLDVVA